MRNRTLSDGGHIVRYGSRHPHRFGVDHTLGWRTESTGMHDAALIDGRSIVRVPNLAHLSLVAWNVGNCRKINLDFKISSFFLRNAPLICLAKQTICC